MTYETAMTMLDGARNGAEIIEVLDILAGDVQMIQRPQTATAMLEPMEF